MQILGVIVSTDSDQSENGETTSLTVLGGKKDRIVMNKFKGAGKKYLLEKAYVQIKDLNRDQWDCLVGKHACC